MRGEYILIGTEGEILKQPLAGPPPLDMLRSDIGDDIAEVPYFTTIEDQNGKVGPCVAFCLDDPGRQTLPFNPRATFLWDAAVRRAGKPELIQKDGDMVAALLGPVVIVTGDAEFMDEL